MGTFNVKVEGATYRVDAPDEQTAWDWANQTHRDAQAKKPVEFTHKATTAEAIAGNPAVRFAVGSAEPVFGLAQLQGRLLEGLGWKDNPASKFAGYGEEYQRMAQKGREEAAQGDPGWDLARITGNILSPAGLVAGKALPAAATALGRAGQAAGMGAGFGAAAQVDDPEKDYWATKGIMVGGGALTSGLLSGGLSLGKGIGKGLHHMIVEPMSKTGVDRIEGRTINYLAGHGKDRLRTAAENPFEIVPGSKPHMGQVAAEVGAPRVAALQEQAAAKYPDPYVARDLAQKGARRSAVQRVGQTPEAIEAATAVRKDIGNQQFGAVRNDVIPNDPRFVELMDNVYIQKAARMAAEKARGAVPPRTMASGKDVFGRPKPLMAGDIENIRQSLSEMLDNPRTGAYERKLITETMQKLNSWLGGHSEGSKVARETSAALAKPITEMKAGQKLEEALGDKAAGVGVNVNQNVETFRKALEGIPKTDITAHNRVKMENVLADLGRDAEYHRLAQAGRQGTPNIMEIATNQAKEATGGASFPSLLHRGAMLAMALQRRWQGLANKKIGEKLAQDMLEPSKIAELMALADTPAKKDMIINAILQTKYGAQAGNFFGNAAGYPYVPGISTGIMRDSLK